MAIFENYFLVVVTEGYQFALDVLGGDGGDDLLSPDQRRKLEDAKKRKRMETLAWPGVPQRPNLLLSLAATGGKGMKKDRTNSPCHDCQ